MQRDAERPRSDELFTPRSRTVLLTAPLLTSLTCPLAFSRTRNWLVPMNAIEVGWVRPDATVLTLRLGTSMVGPPWACTCSPGLYPMATTQLAAAVTTANRKTDEWVFSNLTSVCSMYTPRRLLFRRADVDFRRVNGRIWTELPDRVSAVASEVADHPGFIPGPRIGNLNPGVAGSALL
jgi:hypothetical protein